MTASLSSLQHSLGKAYQDLYDALCGRHPQQRPWHYQWLPTRDLTRDLRRILPTLEGRVLDLGCGAQPYRAWLAKSLQYVGADVEPGPGLDAVLVPGQGLPFADASFDAVVCTQVLEHVEDLDQVLAEIARVLKPSGALVASVPCIYHLHGIPHDYRRFTEFGLRSLLKNYRVEFVSRHGGVGSSMTILGLNWIFCSLTRGTAGKVCKVLTLPLWLPFCLCANLFAVLLDAVDATDSFAHNLLAVARKL